MPYSRRHCVGDYKITWRHTKLEVHNV